MTGGGVSEERDRRSDPSEWSPPHIQPAAGVPRDGGVLFLVRLSTTLLAMVLLAVLARR